MVLFVPRANTKHAASMAPVRYLRTPLVSDGNESCRPAPVLKYTPNDLAWLAGMGQLCCRGKSVAKRRRHTYVLAGLPKGYAGFDAPGKGVHHYMFGHPSGLPFRSYVRFLPHLLWLYEGKPRPCRCELCCGGGKKRKAPGPAEGSARFAPRVGADSAAPSGSQDLPVEMEVDVVEEVETGHAVYE
ncbi:hypothetical protein K470DRAFT_79163 [Piedraia hortae CBS 480.64]|uniref:Cryptic loci regulator 2 N-terminal domain-containing protein n=1 Tax=Piedraia hortae CBS 480.64 TaxID=1314780 RepID=A0A6A7BZZ0_9PEZI|nr:hypothetical protein K470DRAFT_79163 [Piedraia hortae CBS 480.64]